MVLLLFFSDAYPPSNDVTRTFLDRAPRRIVLLFSWSLSPALLLIFLWGCCTCGCSWTDERILLRPLPIGNIILASSSVHQIISSFALYHCNIHLFVSPTSSCSSCPTAVVPISFNTCDSHRFIIFLGPPSPPLPELLALSRTTIWHIYNEKHQ